MARVVGGPSYDWLSGGLSSLARGVAGGMNAATQQQHAVELDELQRRRQLQDIDTQRGFQQEDWRRDRSAHLSDVRAANALALAREGVYTGDDGLDREHFPAGALGGAPRAPQAGPPSFPQAQQGPPSPHLGAEWVNRASSLFTAPPDAPTPDLVTPASAQPNALARLAHQSALRNTASLAHQASPLAFNFQQHTPVDGVGPALPYEEAVARGRVAQDEAALGRAREIVPGNVRPEEAAMFFQRQAPPDMPPPVNPLNDELTRAKIAELDARRRLQGKRGDYIGANFDLRKSDLALRAILGEGNLALRALGLTRTQFNPAAAPESPEAKPYLKLATDPFTVNLGTPEKPNTYNIGTATDQQRYQQDYPNTPLPLVIGGTPGGQSTSIRIGQGAPAPGQTQAPLPQQLGDAIAQTAAAQRVKKMQDEHGAKGTTPARRQQIEDEYMDMLDAQAPGQDDADLARQVRAAFPR